jgi:Fe2+ transport system protein FeoA
VRKGAKQTVFLVDGDCAGPQVCPLSRVQAGMTVCIKKISTDPDLKQRLQELGLSVDQTIKLLARESNFICLVCNARLGISKKLAEAILVETVPAHCK